MTDTETRDETGAALPDDITETLVAEPADEGAEAEPRGRSRRARPRAKKQLIIHAGLHRTGTTAIQEALSGSREMLAAKGISYPFDFAPGEKGPQRMKNHLNLAFALLRNQINPEEVVEWLSQAASGNWKVILSAEDFCRLHDLRFLEALRESFDIEVVFYLRRQDDWVNSWYNQNIRWPFDSTLAKTTPLGFLDHIERFDWLRYFDVLERWERVLGREKLRVRVVEKGQVADVVADLFEICGLPAPAELHRTNESAPATQLELLRRLELINHPNNARVVVLDALARLAVPKASTNVFPAAVRKLVYQRFATQNEKVARVYLDRLDGVLFRDDNFPDDVPNIDGSAPLDEGLLLALIGNLIDFAVAKDVR